MDKSQSEWEAEYTPHLRIAELKKERQRLKKLADNYYILLMDANAEVRRLREATKEMEMMVYLYVDGADVALEHNSIVRRAIENCRDREKE